MGVADAREWLAHPSILAAYFGAEDFIADMGGVRTRSGDEVVVARSSVVLAARLGGVAVVDQIVADFRDDELVCPGISGGESLDFRCRW